MYSSIQNLAFQHIYTSQTANANGLPSEYSFQAEFITILKQLLSRVYPHLLYRVLPEVKVCDRWGKQRGRLDILLRDTNQPSYGFELLVEATKEEFDDHRARAKVYAKFYFQSDWLLWKLNPSCNCGSCDIRSG